MIFPLLFNMWLIEGFQVLDFMSQGFVWVYEGLAFWGFGVQTSAGPLRLEYLGLKRFSCLDLEGASARICCCE